MGINADVIGAIGSVSAAAVALAAAGVAIWQARVASLARDAAHDQAQSAREAVGVARAGLHHAEKPRFAVKVVTPPGGIAPWTTITMLEGPEVDAVIFWERTIWRVEFDPDNCPYEDRRTDTGRYVAQLATNASTMLPWWGGGVPDDMLWMSAKITIEATEVMGEHRTWRHTEAMSWEPPDVG